MSFLRVLEMCWPQVLLLGGHTRQFLATSKRLSVGFFCYPSGLMVCMKQEIWICTLIEVYQVVEEILAQYGLLEQYDLFETPNNFIITLYKIVKKKSLLLKILMHNKAAFYPNTIFHQHSSFP